jgi:hypothetical protein
MKISSEQSAKNVEHVVKVAGQLFQTHGFGGMGVADLMRAARIGRDIEERNDKGVFFERKISHMRLNRSKLQQAMKKRLDKLDKTFLGSDIVDGIGPWRTRR